MNTKTILITTAAALALIARPPVAKAGDEAIAAIGGFIGGVIVGSIASDNHHGSSVVIEAGYGRHSNRNYGRHDSYDRRDSYDHHSRNNRGGRWEYRTVRNWVPGYWTHTRDRCGNRRRVWNSGYHVNTQVRVWVSIAGNNGYRNHDRYDG